MAHARTLIPTSGSTGPFTVPFPYIDKDHVKVRIAGVPVGFSWVTSSTISLDDAPATDSELELRRETPLSPLNTFQNGPIDAAGLNRAVKQALYVAQENDDTFSLTDAGFDSSVAEAAAVAAGLAAAAAQEAQEAAEDAVLGFVKADGTTPFTSVVEFPAGGLRPGGGPSYYESAELAVRTAGGAYGPLSHGGAVRPTLVQAWLRCVDADAGYSVGDEAQPMEYFSSPTYHGLWAWSSPTQVGGLQWHTALAVPHKGTLTPTGITASKWRVVFRCIWL